MSIDVAINAIYESLQNDNHEIDERIAELKEKMKELGVKEAVFEPSKLAQNNRQGRKLMQSYFKKRGVSVKFSDKDGEASEE